VLGLGARVFGIAGSCAAMLAYQAGLWEAGAGALLVVVIVSVAQRDRGQLVGLVSIGLACALVYMALDEMFAATCGGSYQPIVCSATDGPSAISFGIQAAACALFGTVLVVRSASASRRRSTVP
jgi:hypothetical protein